MVVDLATIRFVVLLATSLMGPIAAVQAEDRIWIEPRRPTANGSDWYPGGVEPVAAKVIQFDANQLRYMVRGAETESSIAAQRVIWIEPEKRSAIELEMLRRFKQGRYAESLQKLPECLEQRPPVWHQQWMTMMASVAAYRCGRCKISLELVSQLDRSPLPPVVLAWLPIDWQNGRPSAAAQAQAIARLNDSSPVVQLVAASWLLSSRNRSESLAVLAALTKSERTEISTFAEVLRWRAATPPEVIESAKGWQQAVDRMPMVWQVGPTKTLIDKFQSAGLTDQANRLKWSMELTPIHPSP